MSKDPIYCFTHTDGREVYLFTLQNKKGTTVTVTNYGAIITSFKVFGTGGQINDIVLGFDTVEEYLSPAYLLGYPWFGAAVGRYSNRIKHASFSLDGNIYPLSKNDGNNQLHGGVSGFDKKVWAVVGHGDDPQPWLKLSYVSPDGEEGFPGNLQVQVHFELSNDDELSYTYTATTDQTTAINLTHHEYFNLNNGQGDVLTNEVKIYGKEILEQDETLASTGNLLSVKNTPFDLRDFLSIGEGLKIAGDYDISFVSEKRSDQLVAEARLKEMNIVLQVYSSEPAVHFYTGKWIPNIKGKNNEVYGPYSGFCLETHTHPNAVNIAGFPNTILRPGEIYYQKTVYKVIASIVS